MRLFYLTGPLVRGALNTLRSGQWKSFAAWSTVVLGVLALLIYVFLKIIMKVDTVPLLGYTLNRHIMVMFFMSLMGMLVFSNIVTALGTFYVSQELPLALASPLPYRSVFASKFLETCFQSSWMVLLISAPYLWAFNLNYGGRLSFYLTFFLPMLPFFAVCTSMGIAITLLIARIFPVGQTRNLLRFLMVVAGSLLLLLFRVMRPEQLVHPDKVAMLISMIGESWNPRLYHSPAGWLSRCLTGMMGLAPLETKDLLLIVTSTVLAVGIAYALARWLHVATWLTFQESVQATVMELTIPEMLTRLTRPPGVTVEQLARDIRALEPRAVDRGALRAALEEVFSFLSPADRPVPVERVMAEYAGLAPAPWEAWFAWMGLPMASVFIKDVKTFARSPVIWTQLLLMGLIMVIYVYNVHILPLGTATLADRLLNEGLNFLNIGFVAFISVALALRFGFPAVSMEAKGFFLIHTSPMGIAPYVRVKFVSNLIPMMLIAEVLVVASALILSASPTLLVMGMVDTFFLTLAIVALSIYFGAVYVNFTAESFTRIPSGFGGMVYMVVAMLFVLLFMGLQAYPFWIYFKNAVGWTLQRPGSWLRVKELSGSALLVLVSLAVALWITRWSLRACIRRLTYLEEEH